MNIFLARNPRDVDTAILLDKAVVADIDNKVACTDGEKVFINTDENLSKILPAYNEDMLKWLLWHEEYHKLLRHHNRFFKYASELTDEEAKSDLNLSKEEVNIIMDILVHDTLSKLFPEIIPIAQINCAQFRNRNSLGYTFKTHTLEKMLKEYSENKKGGGKTPPPKGPGVPPTDPPKVPPTTGGTPPPTGGTPTDPPKNPQKGKDKAKEGKDKKKDPTKKGHGTGGTSTDKTKPKHKKEKEGASEKELNDEHMIQDWSPLEKQDSKEFITEYEGEEIQETVNKLKRKKIRLAQVTQTLNGLVTSTRSRTYAVPSRIQVDKGVMLKGRKPSKASLYLCFDASGSMGSDLEMFKQIIQNSIPQALSTPCDWFTRKYGHGIFKDMLGVYANAGYNDDGDRVIQLCYQAEQKGYSPIGVTDGGGGLSHRETIELIKKLKRTIIVGDNAYFLDQIKHINPMIQTICTD